MSFKLSTRFVPVLAALTLSPGCAGSRSSSSSEHTPGEVAASPEAPDGAGPPMYKPSSRSKAPMAITDDAYGAFSAAPDAPHLGETIPDFEVPLADGGAFKLAESRASGPVLIMFYRGFW